MKKIKVKLNTCNYDIIIGFKILNNFKNLWPLIYDNHVMIITNNYVAPLFLNNLYKILSDFNIKLNSTILSDGECNKSLNTVNKIFTILLKNSYNRDSIIIALGGGVIGDLAGFAAAIYQRGIRFIQIPTTLLSQVDASIGGKTAVNHKLGKNMIGAFHQPISVIIDLNYLKTLSKREFSAGLAEIIKYAITFDYAFFIWLENNLLSLINLNFQSLMYCITHCCELKKNIVSQDEYEQNNKRLLLNLGHTYGHAIETYVGYGKWLHGEAISAGIIMSAYTSYIINQLSYDKFIRIKNLILLANLPIKGPKKMSPKKYLLIMKKDKKNINKNIRLILPVSIGKAKVFSNIKNEIITKVINKCYLL